MRGPLRLVLPWLLIAFLAEVSASPPAVEAAGLMRGMAVLVIDGRKEILRVGERSPSGVRLLAADARLARVEIQGEEYDLALSQRVGGPYVEPVGRAVQISSDQRGQFRVGGAINGQAVNFLVDTGASLLAMSTAQAEEIGIDYRAAERGRVSTANGVTEAWFLTLNEVTVGEIRVVGVRAAVVEGAFPADLLLGMSFLRHVGFAEDGGILTLLQRY